MQIFLKSGSIGPEWAYSRLPKYIICKLEPFLNLSNGNKMITVFQYKMTRMRPETCRVKVLSNEPIVGPLFVFHLIQLSFVAHEFSLLIFLFLSVYMYDYCGKRDWNQSVELPTAILITAKRNAHDNPPSLNCSLSIKTQTNHSIQINVERSNIGTGTNCSEERPRLDFCTNGTYRGMERICCRGS